LNGGFLFHFCQEENTALPVNKVLSLIYIYSKLILKTNQAKNELLFLIPIKSNGNLDYHFLNIPFPNHWRMYILGEKDSELAIG
jgi:hypothetical protein